MPYRYENSRGQTYYLHGKEVTLQNDRKQIFWFARAPKAGEALDALPPGRAVVENPRTGLPFLKGTGTTTAPAAAPAAPATRTAPKGTAAAGAQRTATRR